MTGTHMGLVVAALVAALLAVWDFAVRRARHWLRPGHGPLWFVACAMLGLTFLVLLRLSGGDIAAWLATILPVGGEGRQGAFSLLAVALALLIAWFALARVIFGQLRPRARHRSPVPDLFLLFGIAPDGSELVALRARMRWLLYVEVVAAVSVTFALPENVPAAWSFAVAGALGALFGCTHPAEPRTPERIEVARPEESKRLPFQVRIDNLHRWLGSPRAQQTLPAIPAGTAFPGRRRFGIDLYGHQARLLEAKVDHVALAGPDGSGRTTTGILLSLHEAAERGRTTLFVVAGKTDAAVVLARGQAHAHHAPGGAALVFAAGRAPEGSDIWVCTLASLERFLDDQTRLADHTFVRRLGRVIVDDVERFVGPSVARLRFLLHRLRCLPGPDGLRVLITGNLGAGALLRVARQIVCNENVQIHESAASVRGEGARSLSVQRYVVDLDVFDTTATNTESGRVEAHFDRLLQQSDVWGELFGGGWQPAALRGPRGEVEALLVHVGPTSAYRVLARRRYYAHEGDLAREYLVFGTDPMARLLEARYLKEPATTWPKWYDAEVLPRLLSGVPRGDSTPAGLMRIAQEQLLSSLDQASHTAEQIHRVFSDRLAEQELAAVREAGALSELTEWQPDTDGGQVRTLTRYHTSGARRAWERAREAELVVIRDPDTGKALRVERELLGLRYYHHAIVSDRESGARYLVEVDPGHPEHRILRRAPRGTSTPIRLLRHTPVDGKLDWTPTRLKGRGEFMSGSGRIHLRAVHFGARLFDDAQDRTSTVRSPIPLELDAFTTWCRVLAPPTDDVVVLHTLAHVIREVLPYFYLHANEAIGVTYAMKGELSESSGVVLFDRHPDGLGFVNDIDDRQDFAALLEAARAVLGGCACESHCAGCCETTSCTHQRQNADLDRNATVRVLDSMLA